ncbi:hypothetical protein KC318_g2730 [Hortaea werneckii]|uniref:DUF1330 domain-containing protein n=2 Tax=Hortaea werneckii TaxID=91943 RepID=A0A3M6XXZ8_HORWE|nr:hypothetical protein KC334_g5935 [Hortaea werneckii]KAI7008967.1 hypothetical protein KC355_g6731 [Hortaea werneckii]KAI7672659.1 hypothetical protein KC318_g2730 [Hortaea werneckii]RMX95612.1 hypothetical protein D0867_13434 [Hortaea werneckii]RMY29185.1 hypothetical protein D0866_08878 [Hortaea werneckii]
MPLAALHLVALSANATINQFLRAISSQGVKPLVVSRAVRWVIKPEKLNVNKLLDTKWDLLIILPADKPLPDTFLGRDWVTQHWSITAGVPSRVFNGFAERNDRLLHPKEGDVPPLTGSMNKPRMATSTQGLELNDEFLQWSQGFKLGQDGAVSMLNLLAFNPGKEMHESYGRYGKAFAESIGSRRGGNAKVVGKVVPKQGTKDEDGSGWDEIALAHYPSIRHFVDMLASEDYQDVNHRDRLPALKDTCILCTTELDPDLVADKAKL